MKNTIKKLDKNLTRLLNDHSNRMKDANAYLDKYKSFVSANDIDNDSDKAMLADLLFSKYQLLAQDNATIFYHHFRKIIIDLDVSLDITIDMSCFVQDLLDNDYDSNMIQNSNSSKGAIAIRIDNNSFSINDISFLA